MGVGAGEERASAEDPHPWGLMTGRLQELGRGRWEDTRHPFIHSSIRSFIQQLCIEACHVPGTVGGAKDTIVKKTNKTLHPHGIYLLVGKVHNQVSW